MKPLPRLVLAAIFSCAAVWPALAQQSFCVDKEAVVVYGNGVKSTKARTSPKNRRLMSRSS